MDKDKIIRIEAHNSAILVGSNSNTITNGIGPALGELETEVLKILRGLTTRQRVAVMDMIYSYSDQTGREQLVAENKKIPLPAGRGKKKTHDYLFATSAEPTPEVMREVETFVDYVERLKHEQ